MFNPITPAALTHLQDQHAFRAWQVQSDHLEPRSIEILKRKRKAAVYRLTGVGPDGASIMARRSRHVTGRVERLIYQELLPRIPVPSLACYGYLRDPNEDFCWLFLEDPEGGPYSPKSAKHRALAGHWLGEIHLATVPEEIKRQLPDRELGYYLHLVQRCRANLLEHLARTALLAEHTALLFSFVSFCEEIESRWRQIQEACGAMPRTLVHGDFVIKNVRIRNGVTGRALLVFGWQFAGWGVPATDLAQFIDRVVSPDLGTYRSVLARNYPHLELQDVQRVSACGNVLRVVDEMHGALLRLKVGDPASVMKAVALLSVYDATVPVAVQRLEAELG